jgi:hypothetical protein
MESPAVEMHINFVVLMDPFGIALHQFGRFHDSLRYSSPNWKRSQHTISKTTSDTIASTTT